MKRRLKVFICILFFAFGGIVQGFSSGPVASRTGAPGEATCADCHDSFEVNRGAGRVVITGLPKNYQLNQRITFKVSVNQERQKRWGFQITALDSQGKPAGQFSLTDPNTTQIIMGNGRTYVEHTSQGTFPGQMGGAEWTMAWLAPPSDIGPVTFYVAGNAADGSSDTSGDYIYTNVNQVGAPSDPLVTLKTPNGGEVLTGGQKFTITWDSTNAVAHNLLLQLNGTGDIPKTIITGLSADTREFSWTVPNTPTTHARIIVAAEGQQGRADSDTSQMDFTIKAGQVVPGPIINTISVNSKHIKISGSNFVSGINVSVNNIGFTTPSKLKSANSVIQKGLTNTGKTIDQIIPVGSRVHFTLTNPNGGVSEMDYTRP